MKRCERGTKLNLSLIHIFHKKGQQHHHRPGVPFTERMYLPDLRKAPNDSRYKRFSGHRRPILTLNKMCIRDRLLYEQGFHDFTPEGLRNIHRFLFGDIYQWAGEYRIINIAKREKLLAGRSVWYKMCIRDSSHTFPFMNWWIPCRPSPCTRLSLARTTMAAPLPCRIFRPCGHSLYLAFRFRQSPVRQMGMA